MPFEFEFCSISYVFNENCQSHCDLWLFHVFNMEILYYTYECIQIFIGIYNIQCIPRESVSHVMQDIIIYQPFVRLPACLPALHILINIWTTLVIFSIKLNVWHSRSCQNGPTNSLKYMKCIILCFIGWPFIGIKTIMTLFTYLLLLLFW